MSFNGAAASQPRSPGAPWWRSPLTPKLQWGRGFSAAESEARIGRGTARLEASMGPRLLSRGVASRTSRRENAGTGFNGAAASQPRSPACPSGTGDRKEGFNGAAASQPRSRGATPHHALVSVLQWGRGFSAAESRRQRTNPQRALAASMGPRLLSRGVRHAQQPQRRILLASMGPRLLSRGVQSVWVALKRALAASMGPRLLSRGVDL